MSTAGGLFSSAYRNSRPPVYWNLDRGMDIHLDSRGEHLIERQLRSGRYHSAEQVVVSALEALNQDEQYLAQNDDRRRAVEDMLAFAEKHRLTLGEGVRIRDLIHEGHKY